MRVDAPTPDELTLTTERNRLFMSLGLVLAALGLVIGLTMGVVSTFTCHRSGPEAGLCRVRVSSPLKWGTTAILPVRWLEGARVVAHPIPFVGLTAYQLVLSVDDGFGPYPFTWHATHAEARAHATRINAFVEDLEDPGLTLTTDHRPIAWPVAAGFMALGALFLASGAQRLQVVFHRGDQLARVRRRGLVGGMAIDVPFDDIAGFEVAGVRKDCNMFLLRRTGRPVAISLSTDWEAMAGPRAIQAIRRQTAVRAEAFLAAEGAG